MRDKEIRSETVLADSYDPLARPAAITTVYIGINLLSVDELVSNHDMHFWSAKDQCL